MSEFKSAETKTNLLHLVTIILIVIHQLFSSIVETGFYQRFLHFVTFPTVSLSIFRLQLTDSQKNLKRRRIKKEEKLKKKKN